MQIYTAFNFWIEFLQKLHLPTKRTNCSSWGSEEMTTSFARMAIIEMVSILVLGIAGFLMVGIFLVKAKARRNEKTSQRTTANKTMATFLDRYSFLIPPPPAANTSFPLRNFLLNVKLNFTEIMDRVHGSCDTNFKEKIEDNDDLEMALYCKSHFVQFRDGIPFPVFSETGIKIVPEYSHHDNFFPKLYTLESDWFDACGFNLTFKCDSNSEQDSGVSNRDFPEKDDPKALNIYPSNFDIIEQIWAEESDILQGTSKKSIENNIDKSDIFVFLNKLEIIDDGATKALQAPPPDSLDESGVFSNTSNLEQTSDMVQCERQDSESNSTESWESEQESEDSVPYTNIENLNALMGDIVNKNCSNLIQTSEHDTSKNLNSLAVKPKARKSLYNSSWSLPIANNSIKICQEAPEPDIQMSVVSKSSNDTSEILADAQQDFVVTKKIASVSLATPILWNIDVPKYTRTQSVDVMWRPFETDESITDDLNQMKSCSDSWNEIESLLVEDIQTCNGMAGSAKKEMVETFNRIVGSPKKHWQEFLPRCKREKTVIEKQDIESPEKLGYEIYNPWTSGVDLNLWTEQAI